MKAFLFASSEEEITIIEEKKMGDYWGPLATEQPCMRPRLPRDWMELDNLFAHKINQKGERVTLVKSSTQFNWAQDLLFGGDGSELIRHTP